jgi:hypothetical protein
MSADELMRLKSAALQFAQTIAAATTATITPAADKISIRKAYQLFGRAWINRQMSAGNIESHREGKSRNSRIVVSRTECCALLESERNLLKNY